MAAGDELGLGVVAVVDDRFVNTAETRAWIRGDELEVQRLDHIHHEVSARAIGREYFDGACGIDLAWRDWRARLSGSTCGSGRCRLRCLVPSRADARAKCGRAGDGCGLQEITTIDGMLL